jgi:hypothetical protein
MLSFLRNPALLVLSGITLVQAGKCGWVRFDTNSYYTDLDHGDSALHSYHASQESGAYPLPTVTVEQKRSKDELLIYDTSFMGPYITGADPDLEVGKGNAIIVQRPGFDDKDNYPDTWQLIGRPDDSPDGGWIRFSLDGPAMIKDMEFVDLDEHNKLPKILPYLSGSFASGTPTGGYLGPATEGKATGQLWLTPAPVADRVDVQMRSSGGILGIYICEYVPY